MPSTPRERALSLLSGTAPAEPVCMQTYLGLFFEDRRRRALAQVYRERLGGAPERTLGLEQVSEAEIEAWARAWSVLISPPAWIPVRGWPTRSTDGTRILQKDGRILVVAPGGQPVDVVDGPRGSTTDLWDRRPAMDPARLPEPPSLRTALSDGWLEHPRRAVERFGGEFLAHAAINAPFCAVYAHLGFAGMMEAMRNEPELLDAITANRLAHARVTLEVCAEAGIECVFVEETLSSSDLISEADYLRFSYPSARDLFGHARDLGLRTVYYYCGAIEDRLEHLAALPADALAFEESKKDFTIDLGAIRNVLGPGRPLLGNIDATFVRDAGDDALRRGVEAQFEAAGPLLATSAGSPLTLDTDVRKLDLMVELSAQCGA